MKLRPSSSRQPIRSGQSLDTFFFSMPTLRRGPSVGSFAFSSDGLSVSCFYNRSSALINSSKEQIRTCIFVILKEKKMVEVNKFLGKFKLDKSENFDEYMKALGVGLLTRKIGNAIKNTYEITINGEQWTLKTISTFKTVELKFQLGVEFDEATMDGRNVKTTFTLEDGKLVQRQKATKHDQKNCDLIREMTSDNEMLTTLIVYEPDGSTVTAKRHYKRDG